MYFDQYHNFDYNRVKSDFYDIPTRATFAPSTSALPPCFAGNVSITQCERLKHTDSVLGESNLNLYRRHIASKVQ